MKRRRFGGSNGDYYCQDCEFVEDAFGKRYLSARIKDVTNTKVNQYNAESKRGLFIHGPVGTGKTHIAAALLRTRSGMGNTVPRLLLSLRKSFEDQETSEAQIIDRYSRYSFLVLDDMGAEKSSEYSIQSLYLIIDQRYRDMLPTIITSNLSLTELANKLDDRIASRIAGMCDVVKLTGKDRRLSKS